MNRSQPLKAVEPQVVGARDLVIYTGNRQGGFGIRGQATGVRYTVPGRGDFLVDQEGRPGVDKRDTGVFLRINRGRDFQKVTPPASTPKPQDKGVAPTPVAVTPQDARAWKPDVMVSEPVLVEETAESEEVADPSALTLKQLKTLDLSHWQATQMLALEKDGKARKTVIAWLEKATEN